VATALSKYLDMDHSIVQKVYVADGQWEFNMRVSVSDAKAQLTELVRRAEAGDEIVLTRHGQPAVRLVPVRPASDGTARRKLLDAARIAGAAKAITGPDAAHSQDFLYGDGGLPA
jgi:prevent-host-death family protein